MASWGAEERIGLLVGLIQLMNEAAGEDPRVGDIYEVARHLASGGLFRYTFLPGTWWSSELWSDLDTARSQALLWYYDSSRGSVLPRRRVSLTEKGRHLACQSFRSVSGQVLTELRRAINAAMEPSARSQAMPT